MVRKACCSDIGLNKGPWTPEEDLLLKNYVQTHGEGRWSIVPHKTGLVRCGRSCRLRWMNYLRPDIKHDNISADEDELIIRLHKLLGNRWSLIAARIPGRTDNQIKNAWYSRLSKKIAKSTRTDVLDVILPPDHGHCRQPVDPQSAVLKPLPYRPPSNETILTGNEISYGGKDAEKYDNATNIFQPTNYYEEEIKQACEDSTAGLPDWPLTVIQNTQNLVGSSDDNVMDRGIYWASNPQEQNLNGIEGSCVRNGIGITLQNAIDWYNLQYPCFDPTFITEQVPESHAAVAPSPFYMNY